MDKKSTRKLESEEEFMKVLDKLKETLSDIDLVQVAFLLKQMTLEMVTCVPDEKSRAYFVAYFMNELVDEISVLHKEMVTHSSK